MIEEIRKGLELLYVPGDVIEMRVPRKHGEKFAQTTSGFFNDLDKLARAIELINDSYKQTVFTTMNPLAPKDNWAAVNNRAYVGSAGLKTELLAAGLPLESRMNKSVLYETGKEHWTMKMTEDGDVLKRRWILIDIDAGQSSGTNSTDAQHASTLLTAKAVIQHLVDRGFPAPGLTNSGNGHHVYVRVDLPNDATSALLVKRFLLALGQRFDNKNGTASVDKSTFNAARITKAHGSMVYKGEDTPERPQRRSGVLNFASKKFTATDLILEVAQEYTLKEGESLEAFTPTALKIDDAELQAQIDKIGRYLAHYGIESKQMFTKGGDVVIPVTCPNSEEHTMDGGELETIIMIGHDGALSFCCQHGHCSHLRSWKGLRNFLQRNWTGQHFQWSPAPASYFSGDTKYAARPQQDIYVTPKPSAQDEAVAFLKTLTLPIPIKQAQALATAAGISPRTLATSYDAAGLEPKNTFDGWMLTKW